MKTLRKCANIAFLLISMTTIVSAYGSERTNIQRYKKIGFVVAEGLAFICGLIFMTDENNQLAGGVGTVALLTATYLALSINQDED